MINIKYCAKLIRGGFVSVRRVALLGAVVFFLCAASASAGTFAVGNSNNGVPGSLLRAFLNTNAATFVVSNFNDAGPGSLRQAILDANASPGNDMIQVSNGTGTIDLVTPLPAITGTVQIINFDTGSGRVELNGLATRSGAVPSIGFDIQAPNCEIWGFAINRFGDAGIRVGINSAGTSSGSGTIIHQNYIGTNIAGTSVNCPDAAHPCGNLNRGIWINGATAVQIGVGGSGGHSNTISGNFGNGITVSNAAVGAATFAGSAIIKNNYIGGAGTTGNADLGNSLNGILIAGTSGNQIGGTASNDRNYILGNGGNGISIAADKTNNVTTQASNNNIQGNYIGYTLGTNQSVPNNGSGIVIRGSNNTVGGAAAAERNIIVGNRANGISISGSFATGNVVTGNYIGVGSDGTTAYGNSVGGIQIADFASNNTIGGIGVTPGTCNGPCNIIANNGDSTVQSAKAGIYLDLTSGIGNAVRGNVIFNNGAAVGLGIDLGTPGANTNDAGDPDTGANDLQNRPVITDANSFGLIHGTIDSNSSTSFSIDLYRNDAADGAASEARIYIGSTAVTTNGSGAGTFTYLSPVALSAGQFITATATRVAAPFDSSELSAAVAVIQGTGSTPTNSPTSTATNTATSTATNTSTNTPTNTATPTPPAVISGTVTYGNAAGTPTPRFVSNVTITGAGSPNVSTTTAAPGANAGQYSLTGFGSGSYTVTPTKTTGQNGISSFDAARIAQHVAGPPLPRLTGNQLIVADTSNNGTLSSFDAALVARYVVSSPPFGIAGNWIFIPASRNYPSVNGSIANQDYSALLMGEVSGDWNNSGARPIAIGPVRNTAVKLPQLMAPQNGRIVIPISADGVADNGIISYEFELRYDPAVISPAADPVDLTGTISRGLSVAVNAKEPGILRVAVYGAIPVNGNGVLLNLKFIAVGAPGTVTPLTLERMMFNEGDPKATANEGWIKLEATTTN
jgi:hypothetical protein